LVTVATGTRGGTADAQPRGMPKYAWPVEVVDRTSESVVSSEP
jgi:hypothetical protein